MWYLFLSPYSSCDYSFLFISSRVTCFILLQYSSRDSLFLFLFIMWYLFPSPIHHVILGTCSCSSYDTYFLLLFITWFLELVPVHHMIPISFSYSSRDSWNLFLFIMWYLFPSPIHHVTPCSCSCSCSSCNTYFFLQFVTWFLFLVSINHVIPFSFSYSSLDTHFYDENPRPWPPGWTFRQFVTCFPCERVGPSIYAFLNLKISIW
jgi:hypothetical protein